MGIVTFQELIERIERGYQDYLEAIMRERFGVGAPTYSYYGFGLLFEQACTAAFLMRDYDYGIAIARGGLWLGYIFSLFDFFPVLPVLARRKGLGASWQPLISFENLLRDKKVLVFENDIVTGRTLKRTIRELERLKPCFVDLLLIFRNTLMSFSFYQKMKSFFSSGKLRYLGQTTDGYMCIDTSGMIPQGFRKAITLQEDIEPLPEAMEFLKKKLETWVGVFER